MFLLVPFIAAIVFGGSIEDQEYYHYTEALYSDPYNYYGSSHFFDIYSYDQYSPCYNEFFTGTKSQWEKCCWSYPWSPNCDGKFFPYDSCYDVMDVGLAGVESAAYFSYTNSHWSDCCYNSCDAFSCTSEYCVSIYESWVYWAWIAIIIASVLLIALLIALLICCGCCGCCGCMACCRCCDPSARRLARLQNREEKRLAKEEAEFTHKQQLRDVEAGAGDERVARQSPAHYPPDPVEHRPFPTPAQATNPVYVYVNEQNTTIAPDVNDATRVDRVAPAPIRVQHQINQVRVLSSSEEDDELPKPPK